MHNPFYLLVLVAGICSLWLLWDKAIKSWLLDLFRERLFELRFSMFEMGMQGELDFDSVVYRQLEVLFCGLLRYGHRMTLLTYFLSSIEQQQAKKDNDYVDISQQIATNIARLNPEAQKKLTAILGKLQHAIFTYMAFTSLLFLTFVAVMRVAKALGIWIPEKGKISSVIEQEAYRAEFKRDGVSLSASAA